VCDCNVYGMEDNTLTSTAYHQFFRKSLILIGLLLLITIVAVSFMSVKAGALSATSQYRECDNNAVLKCGTLTTNEVKLKYIDSQDATGRIIFNDFGINDQDINSINDGAVSGRVTKDGNVYVGKKLVATNAVTAGRQNIAGSTPVSSGGTTYYKRPPSVSFKNNSIEAFVIMQNNQFRYAILTSCGNPVTATPVTPPPTPKVETPAPPVVIEKEKIVEVPAKPVVVEKEVIVKEIPPQQPVVKEIPNVGPGNLLVVFIMVSTIAGSSHYIMRNKLR
jgi:hypothetical protein